MDTNNKETYLKTSDQSNHDLVKSIFMSFCDERDLTPYLNCVTWEHEGFSCSAENADEETVQFRAVDAACPTCLDSNLDTCPSCGRHNEIDFEEV